MADAEHQAACAAHHVDAPLLPQLGRRSPGAPVLADLPGAVRVAAQFQVALPGDGAGRVVAFQRVGQFGPDGGGVGPVPPYPQDPVRPRAEGHSGEVGELVGRGVVGRHPPGEHVGAPPVECGLHVLAVGGAPLGGRARCRAAGQPQGGGQAHQCGEQRHEPSSAHSATTSAFPAGHAPIVRARRAARGREPDTGVRRG